MGLYRKVPMNLSTANDFVLRYHRHHKKVVGLRFAFGLKFQDELIGVCIVGRPVARGFDSLKVAEVTRLCIVGGYSNACSIMYSTAARVCKELGFEKIITYTLDSESGVTLKASGWKQRGEVRGRSWTCPSRERTDKHPTVDKVRWEKDLD